MSIIKSAIKNNLIVSTIHKLYEVLPPGYKKRSFKMLALLLVNSIFEMIGLAAFLPLFSVILQPGVIQQNRYFSVFYDLLGFSSDRQFILFLVTLIVLVIILKNMASLLIVRSQAKFSLSLYKYFADRLHQLYYSKGFPFFKSTNSNVILRNINVIPSQFSNNVVLNMLNLLNEFVVLLLILLGLMLYDVKAVVLLTVTVLPVFLLFYNWVKGRSLKLEQEVNSLTPKLSQSIFQSVHGFTDVEITNTQKQFRKRITDFIDRIVALNIRRTVYNAAPTKVIESGMVITIFAITTYGLFFLDSAGLAALLGLFALAAYRILPSVNRIMIALVAIKGYQYTFDVISEVKGFVPEEYGQKEVVFNDSILVDNLFFRFPDSDRDVLSGINLRMQKGESIGIMGASGSGKTTLINLLLGFWTPTDGHITIDNVPLSKETMKSWRDRIGYVQQEVYIVDGTVAENVAFGIEPQEINFEKLEEVLRQASLWDFIQTLSATVHTNIGERGARLSGGQRQRIGIARALYSGADVLLFDEATSALDSQTENEITESIKTLNNGEFTFIIIAHRGSTLRYCNRIINIGNGVLNV